MSRSARTALRFRGTFSARMSSAGCFAAERSAERSPTIIEASVRVSRSVPLHIRSAERFCRTAFRRALPMRCASRSARTALRSAERSLPGPVPPHCVPRNVSVGLRSVERCHRAACRGVRAPHCVPRNAPYPDESHRTAFRGTFPPGGVLRGASPPSVPRNALSPVMFLRTCLETWSLSSRGTPFDALVPRWTRECHQGLDSSGPS